MDLVVNIVLAGASVALMAAAFLAFRSRARWHPYREPASTRPRDADPARVTQRSGNLTHIPTLAELGRWSTVAAFLTFLAGLYLLLYTVCVPLAPLFLVFARGRALFFVLFVWTARAVVLTMPLVLVQMPLTGLLAFRLALCIVALSVVDALFGPTLLSALFLPLALLIFLLTLRLDWRRGRLRQAAPQTSAAALERAQPFAQSIVQYGPAGLQPGAFTVPGVSSGAVIANVAESIFLVLPTLVCTDASLHAFFAVFALIHAGFAVLTLRGESVFA
jgi:hypothetical protein